MSAAATLSAQTATRLDPAALGALASHVLTLELETHPKPGLVGPHDSGSHADMGAATFRASIAALEPFFVALAGAARAGAGMPELRHLGLRAEAAMRAATGGVNTHRGAIFGLGLLVAAAGALGGAGEPGRLPAGALGAHVRRRHGAGILNAPVPLDTPGAAARRRHRTGGAPAEAASGFPTLYGAGLPALRQARARRPDDPQAHRVAACIALIAALDDTNLLHRGGLEGALFAKAQAKTFLAAGGVAAEGWQARALAMHRAFVARRLSPGGAADLLAMTLFVDALEEP